MFLNEKLRIIGFKRAIKKAIKKETREESEYAVTVAAMTSNQSPQMNISKEVDHL